MTERDRQSILGQLRAIVSVLEGIIGFVSDAPAEELPFATYWCPKCRWAYNEETGCMQKGAVSQFEEAEPGTRFSALLPEWECPICGTLHEEFEKTS